MVRRAAGYVLGPYVLFALVGRFVEAMGAVHCGCAADCWCKRPILSTFRWVFPWGHRSAAEGLNIDQDELHSDRQG
jgi:hypothetical protein